MASRNLASLTEDKKKTLLLKDRNPPCYQLITNKEYLDERHWKPDIEGNPDGKIRRWRFGNADTEKKKKTIVMLGETGTGKTTLINSIVTHLLGVTFEDKMWFEITGEEQKTQAKSQTACVTVYEIYMDDNPMSYAIIDTPGYGDTEGIEEDKKIPQHLLKLFTSFEGVHTINTIGLVVKASQNRLTASQQYIFNEVVSLFGHNVEKSIVIFFTHSDGTVPKDGINAIKEANIPCAKDEHGELVYFSFNNTLLTRSETQPIAEKTWTKLLRKFEGFWSDREESMDEFLNFLGTADEISMRMTEEVIRSRQTLNACIINLQQRIAKMQEEQNELEQIENAVQVNKSKLDNNENFEIEVDEPIQKLVPIKEIGLEEKATHFSHEKATHCSHCQQNCHFPGCTWVREDSLWLCHVMTKGEGGDYHCTVCTNRCSYKKHVKNEQMYITVTQKTKKTSEILRKQYEEEYGKGMDMQACIKEKLNKLKIEQAKIVDEAYERVMKLQEIALKKDPPSVLLYLDVLISKLRDHGKQEEASKLEEIQCKAPPVSSGVKALYKMLVSCVRRT